MGLLFCKRAQKAQERKERVQTHFLCLLKIAFATMCAPRSEGMLSKPHMCTIFTFLAAASLWYFLMVLDTHGTSPAGHSPCVMPVLYFNCSNTIFQRSRLGA